MDINIEFGLFPRIEAYTPFADPSEFSAASHRTRTNNNL
jgi:hypothetical protein